MAEGLYVLRPLLHLVELVVGIGLVVAAAMVVGRLAGLCLRRWKEPRP